MMLQADYLIIGAGALGMTFADEMLTASDASIIIVDRHHMPGGHWNDAYPFVRLHQPSAFYGVGSRQLGSNRIDESPLNRGLYELASHADLLSYFDGLMRDRFLPSGRVRYFPMSDYLGGGKFRSLLSGVEQTVTVRRKIVDTTFVNTSVPSTHTRKYTVADGVAVIPPNALPAVAPSHTRFTLVGGGKTAMDAGMWLLLNGADPAAMRWIVPRDSWLINRETIQPGDAFARAFMAGRASQVEAGASAVSADDAFDRMERDGHMLRIDTSVRPTMYHSATMSPAEVESLRAIKDVVRLGRVRLIEPDRILLDRGEVAARADDLYIDCTAKALDRRTPVPVFSDGLITIQTVRAALFCLSAAAIAQVEASCDSDDEKNRLCPSLVLPDTPDDWLQMTLGDLDVGQQWAADPGMRKWLSTHRLTGANLRGEKPAQPDLELKAIRTRMIDATPRAMENLARLVRTTA